MVFAELVGPLDRLRLVVGHRLHGIDKVDEFQTAINVFVESADPVLNVCVIEFLCTHVLTKEDSHVVTVDLAVRVFVNQTEDRQDGVVEATDKLTGLKKFHWRTDIMAHKPINVEAQRI